MSDFDRKKIVFHGSSLPPGTPSTTLRKPTLKQPLFVADNPEAAIEYAGQAAYNPSVFVFQMKKDPRTFSFDFNQWGQVKKLGPRLPMTTKYLEAYMYSSGKRFNYEHVIGKSFFNAIRHIADICSFGLDEAIALYLKDDDQILIGNVLQELGMGKMDGTTFTPIPELKRLCSSSDDITIRRLLKSKIYEVIQKMGYNVVMDMDTTGQRIPGNEFAILDLSAIEDGIVESMAMINVERNIKYAYEDIFVK